MSEQVLLFEQEIPLKQEIIPALPEPPMPVIPKKPKRQRTPKEIEVLLPLVSKCFHNKQGECQFVAGCGPCTFCWNWCIVDKREIKDLFEYLGKKEVDKIFGEDPNVSVSVLRDDYE